MDTDLEKTASMANPGPRSDTSPSSARTNAAFSEHLQDATDEKSDANTSAKDDEPPNIVDYDGPDDPDNPYNWSKTRKWTNGGLLSIMTLITPLASSMFAPGVLAVMREFHSDNQLLAPFVVSVYVLGYAVGPLLIAPLSELYGRLYVYHVANVLYIVFTIACAVSSSLGMLIAFRFLAGAVGATPLTIGGGSMGDMFPVTERGGAMAVWTLGPLLGPIIGPVAGGYLSQAKGWRWTFWVIAIVASASSIAMAIFSRETYAPRILSLKTRRLRKETGNENLISKLDTGHTPKQLFARSIVRPLKMLFLSPIVFLLSLYMAIVYGYLYLLFTTFPQVFEGIYGFSQGSVGLTYLGLGIGTFLGLIVVGSATDAILKRLTAKNGGVAKPEFRLPPMVPASTFIPIGLFIYGWTAEYAVHWMAPIIGTAFVGLGMITIFMPITTYLVDAFTVYSASALAANTVLRSLFGAVLPLAGPSMYRALGLGWGNSLLGFIALAMVPVTWLLWRYGERIRTRFALNF